jgi:hypothetical protein
MVDKKTLLIKHIPFGIASRIGDCVYVHKDLANYPKLYNAILNHEYEHTSGYSWKDLAMDFRNDSLKGHKKEYWKFMFTHPSAWLQLSPILMYDKRTTFDITLFFFYSLIILIIGTFGLIIWK